VVFCGVVVGGGGGGGGGGGLETGSFADKSLSGNSKGKIKHLIWSNKKKKVSP
jgi:hypothetical protein